MSSRDRQLKTHLCCRPAMSLRKRCFLMRRHVLTASGPLTAAVPANQPFVTTAFQSVTPPARSFRLRSRAAKPQRWPRARPGRKSSSPSHKPQHPFPAGPPSCHANGPSQPPGDCLCRLSLRQRVKVQTRSTNRGGGWRVPQNQVRETESGAWRNLKILKCQTIKLDFCNNVRSGRRRNARCFCVAPLQAITPAISEERKFGLAGKRGGLAKARSAVTPAASAAIRPARAGALRARNRTARWLSRPAALDYDRHTTKARREAGLCVETLNRRQPIATS